jgi:hypothetical protein
MNVIDLNFLVYFSLVGIAHTYHYFSKYKANEVAEANLNYELIKSKLDLLQAQINPHFLLKDHLNQQEFLALCLCFCQSVKKLRLVYYKENVG